MATERITQTGTLVTHAETGAPGEVIDICDGYRVRVRWELNGRVTRIAASELRTHGRSPLAVLLDSLGRGT